MKKASLALPVGESTGAVRLSAWALRVAAICAAGVVLHPGPSRAQDMEFGLEETEGQGGSDTDFSEQSPQGGDGDVIGDLAGEQSGRAGSSTREAAPRLDEAREEIFAVQQIYALRINRVELIPTVSFTLNDPFISHTGIGLGLNYWFTNVLAIGANFVWYEGLESESDIGYFVRRSSRLAVPVNSYQFGTHLAFTYVPIYGKFSMFNEFIFQYDIYVLGGFGVMNTRPIPVIDPEIRRFDYNIRVAFNVGVGLRVFVTRWLAVVGELRNYMYLEQLENLEVALGSQRQDAETWTQSSPTFVNNVTAHLGLSVFLPFDFEYRRPR